MKTKQKQFILLGMMLSCVLFTACPKSTDTLHPYDGETIGDEVDLSLYIPFSDGNKLATLSENASIQFSENLPKLDGSTALYPVYASFVQATYPSIGNYTDLSNGVVRCTKTPNAFINLINGDVDIIFTAAPSQQQEKMAEEQGKTFVKTPIGKDAFVFFVHKNNPVNGLTIEQIQGIYSGRITNWAEVGGSDIEIVAYQRNYNSGSQTALVSIMDGIPIMTPPSDWLGNSMTGGFQRIVEYRNHSRAVGFSFLFFTNEMVASNEIKLLAIEGVPPTRETIRANQYPFSGAFYAITTGNETENTKKLIEWVLSDEGQYLIEKTGYVPLKLPASN